MASRTLDQAIYHLEEGHLAIDFVNTSALQLDERAPFGYVVTEESLTDLPALASWGEKVGLLNRTEIDLLITTTASGPRRRLETLIELREALRQIIRAHTADQPIPGASLAIINQSITPHFSRTRLIIFDHGFRVEIAGGGRTTDANEVIDHIFWAIGQSALSLLTDSHELKMIEECPADDCGYLFRDTSHGRRRWCSMKSCGNRAKVQRFRDRQRRE